LLPADIEMYENGVSIQVMLYGSHAALGKKQNMTRSQRCTGIILLQLILMLFPAFSGGVKVSCLPQNDVDVSNRHVSQYPDNLSIECADIDEDTVGTDHVSTPEYSIHSIASLPKLTSNSGMVYLNGPDPFIPLVYLPVFSPPKIIA
jgi:hypothetical protein